MMVSKRNLLFQGAIFRFHVKLGESIPGGKTAALVSTVKKARRDAQCSRGTRKTIKELNLSNAVGEWHLGVSKNRGTPKWMVYNGKPY